MLRRNGQTTLEYAVFIVVFIAALVAMQLYAKRAIQGRWKEAMDDVGEQYDPRISDNQFTDSVTSTTKTRIFVEPAAGGGQATMREDTVQSTQTRTGTLTTPAE